MQTDTLVSDSNKKQHGLPYTWIIITICFLMIFANYGFCSSNRGLYLTAITEAHGMKRSVFSISDTCRHAATACKMYGIDVIELCDIDKRHGHPTVLGMKQIKKQVLEYINM